MVDTRELKAQMVRKGFNQTRLASACGVSCPTMTRLFKYGYCDLELAEKVASVLDIEDTGAVFFAKKVTL